MARDHTASLDGLINDLRGSLREALELLAVEEPVLYLRYNEDGPLRFDQTLRATIRDVEDAKVEGAAVAQPVSRRLLDERDNNSGRSTAQIVASWGELENLVRERLEANGFEASDLGAEKLLGLALQRNLITNVQHRSLRGLNVMRNLAVHGHNQEVDAERTQEFLALAEAMKTVLEI